MKTYIVFRNSQSGHVEVVKRGYSIPALSLNLIQLGWVWAFAKRAPDFGWRLLAVTVISSTLCYCIPLLSLLWIACSVSIGQIANHQVVRVLKKRGFSQIGEVEATDPDEALTAAHPLMAGVPGSTP